MEATTGRKKTIGAENRGAPTDFIRAKVVADLRSGKYEGRVVTRFPPEPNGFLHIGHAKSICLNFGIAEEHAGVCHLRFDDTNPETEDLEYVEAIQRDVRWLGFDWGDHLYFASDYFERLYEYAVQLIESGKAYVDSLSEEEIREYRGTVTEPGRESPNANRSVEENLKLFERMKNGELADGSHVLRAKIDMASSNMLMRDPLLYRIRHAHHYRRGGEWCIYPMYDFAHCLSDAIENVTHSLCTLEFENNREIYDWVLDAAGIEPPRTEQTEFARLNLDYTILSKRKLIELVEGGHVSGWDDPRMPTLAGMRRRGVTPEAIRSFCDMIGVAKVDSRVDVARLEYAVRNDLNHRAPRVLAVLDPLKLIISNYREGMSEELDAPYYPHDVPKEGSRKLPFSRQLYIERDDFMESPPKNFHRLAPGREVRLRYAYLIQAVDVVKDPKTGDIIEVHCTYDPATRGGSAPDGRKVKGTIHWVSAEHALPAEVRLYDRLFLKADPDDVPAGEDCKSNLNPNSLVVVEKAHIEPSVAADPPGSHYQFERLGYFYSDPIDSRPDGLVFNRTVSLRDTWAKLVEKSEAQTRKQSARPNKSSTERTSTRPKKGKSPVSQAADPEAASRARRLIESYGIAENEAQLIAGDAGVAELFDEAVAAHDSPKAIAAWVINDVFALLKDQAVEDMAFSGAQLGSLVALIEAGGVSRHGAKEVFAEMAIQGDDPEAIVKRRGLRPLTDAGELTPIIDRLIADSGDKVEEYRAGKIGLLGFFVGQVMRMSGGRADPEAVKRLIQEKLG